MDRTDNPSPPSTGIHYAECPHCHHEVMVRPDGICLACGKDQNDHTGTQPEMTMLLIENVSQLPANCFLCGTETRRMQTFRLHYRATAFAVPSWMLPLARMMAYVPGSEYSTSETLRLPTCPACAAHGKKVKPLSIWSGLDCRILVHRIFRERFEALNGTRPLDFGWEAETRICRGPAAGEEEKLFASGIGMRLK